jgi:CRISPR system Cascade subunit CasA
MPSFDVLKEGWIPVEKLDGSYRVTGMLDVLVNAHKIRCVKAASPLVTYGIQRTLIAFLIDALRPYDVDELEEIVSAGKFDPSNLNAYIEKCISEGTSFDLFDRSHPFLQIAKNELDGKEKVLVNRLFFEIPEGNNHSHFVHKVEGEHVFTSAECLQALCTIPAFAMNYGTNACFSINGVPPVYFLYAGRNLFETLSLSMIAESEHSEIPLDDPPVVWRNFHRVVPGGKLSRTSLLYGMTCQSRCINLIPYEQNGCLCVKEMYYDKGWDFKELPNWIDPHVVYIHNKKDDYTLRAYKGRAVWRDIGSIISPESTLKILNEIGRKLNSDTENIYINTIGLAGRYKGPVYAIDSWFEESMNIDIQIMEDEKKAMFVMDTLSKAEDVNKVLYSVLKKSIRQLQGNKGADNEHSRYANLIEQAQTIYFSNLRSYIFGDFSSKLAKTDASKVDWMLEIKKETGKALKSYVLNAFSQICEKIGSSARTLEWVTIAEIRLRQWTYRELKGGWLDEQ